ncbi:MAG: DUF302 domain-containing protein [Thiohalomonadaceae bacterium]
MFRATTPKDVDTVIKALLAAVDVTGMRVVCHINGQANAAKMGKQVPADQILEIFRPDFAIRVWSACKEAGIDIPLRIYVYETDNGSVVQCRLPKTLFAPYQSTALMAIAEELEAIFQDILATIPEASS